MSKVLIHGPLSLYSMGFYENPDEQVITSSRARAFSQITKPTTDMRAQTPQNENRVINPLARIDADHSTEPNVEVLKPVSIGFLTFCVLAGSLFCALAIWLAWYSGLKLLPTLAVYFAVANAVLLGAAVLLMLLCKESYDIE